MICDRLWLQWWGLLFISQCIFDEQTHHCYDMWFVQQTYISQSIFVEQETDHCYDIW